MGLPQGAGAGLTRHGPSRGLAAIAFASLVAVAGLFALAAPRPAAAQGRTHVLIVAGLGGTAEYRERFHSEASALKTALTERHGLPEADVVYLGENEGGAGVDGHATVAEITKVLGEIAQRAAADDRVLVVLIGHGTYQGGETRFNLPGPDLGPEDFARGLAAFPTQTLALVHTGSASGGFLAPLSGPNRVLVTATRSERELNATEFSRYFVEAVADEGADLDHDGRVSLLEAFEYARGEVARFYEEENELLTEHAVLDDNGDGEGSREASANGTDGRLAASFHLGRTGGRTGAVATDDPALAALYEERAEIQRQIEQLQAVQESMTREQYEEQLEELLVQLALKNREIRALEGGEA